MANDLVLNPGMILPMGYADIQSDDKAPKYAKGQLGLVRDNFGVRILRYMHNALAAAANTTAGGLYSRAADVTPTQATGGTTTTLKFNAASFTAGALVDRVAYFKTNGTVAGAAPEGESATIASNDTTTLQLDPKRPLSATPNATGDTVVVFSLFDFIKAASGDLAPDVFGVGLATAGIANGNWGVLQAYGWCPDVKFKSGTALAAKKAVIADVEQVTASSTSGVSLFVGWLPEAVNATNGLKTLVFVNVFSPEMVSA